MFARCPPGVTADQSSELGPTCKGVLVLGSAGGKLKTGQHLIVNNEPQANLFIALLNALNVPATTFGTAGKEPIAGIL